MAKMSQCERILKYIDEQGSISQLEALETFGCMRLASQMSDLKKMGYSVTKRMETSKNRYGEPISYARYSICR